LSQLGPRLVMPDRPDDEPLDPSVTADFAAVPTGTVITIDGPAGAGKSSLARRLAKLLGFDFLDTGGMYRCVTWGVLQRELDPARQPEAVAHLAERLEIEMRGERFWVDGQEVTDAIRQPEIGRAIGPVSDNPAVRRRLVELQRQWAGGRRLVTEGRDQGSVVFPNAALKIFLTASPEERARRRWEQLGGGGDRQLTLERILADQIRRDAQDEARPYGGLRAAPDAVHLGTDSLTLPQVTERLIDLARQRLLPGHPSLPTR
jgi:CMP/dCMP kinase